MAPGTIPIVPEIEGLGFCRRQGKFSVSFDIEGQPSDFEDALEQCAKILKPIRETILGIGFEHLIIEIRISVGSNMLANSLYVSAEVADALSRENAALAIDMYCSPDAE